MQYFGMPFQKKNLKSLVTLSQCNVKNILHSDIHKILSLQSDNNLNNQELYLVIYVGYECGDIAEKIHIPR